MVSDVKLAFDELADARERPLFGREAGYSCTTPQLPQQLFTLLVAEPGGAARGAPPVECPPAASVELIVPSAQRGATHVKLASNGGLREFAPPEQARAFTSSFFKLCARQLRWCPCHANQNVTQFM